MEGVRYQDQGFVAAEHASVDERINFIRMTYLHLGGAILACVGLTAALLNSAVGQKMAMSMLRGKSRFPSTERTFLSSNPDTV